AVAGPPGLYARDRSRPAPPEAIGQLQSAATPQAIEVMERDGHTTACVVGGGTVQLYDVTDPAKPVLLTSLKTASGRPTRITLDGVRAYVADARQGVQILDLT